MMQEKISEDTFIVYAMNNYENPQCQSVEEFDNDLKKFLYLRKLISRYQKTGDLKERLILNHIIILYNIFGIHATNMLFFKIEQSCWNILTTFLVYLERMPNEIPQYGIILSDVKLDETVIDALRNI